MSLVVPSDVHQTVGEVLGQLVLDDLKQTDITGLRNGWKARSTYVLNIHVTRLTLTISGPTPTPCITIMGVQREWYQEV